MTEVTPQGTVKLCAPPVYVKFCGLVCAHNKAGPVSIAAYAKTFVKCNSLFMFLRFSEKNRMLKYKTVLTNMSFAIHEIISIVYKIA